MPASLVLSFEGFVQIRLATDPDPCDEPRGISGWTFAVAGEPDMDRQIVLQEDDPRRVARQPGPTVGVTVRKVTVNGREAATHPLLGARVEMLDSPRFEGRNWIIADDGNEPIDPFHVKISSGQLVLEKEDQITDAKGKVVPFFRADPELIQRRKPVGLVDSKEVLAAIGVKDPRKWRQARQQQLQAMLPSATGTARTALEKRIRDLSIGGPAIGTVGFGMQYQFPMQGPGTVSDPTNALGSKVDAKADWPVQVWVGGWDADALCAYMRGSLTIPFVGAAPLRRAAPSRAAKKPAPKAKDVRPRARGTRTR